MSAPQERLESRDFPEIDLAFLKGKVSLAAGVTLTLQGIVLTRYRETLPSSSPGMDLLANTSPDPARGPALLLLYQSALRNRFCFPVKWAQKSVLATPRPALWPGEQNVTQITSQDGCINSTAAPLLRRCWAARRIYNDVATPGLVFNKAGSQTPTQYLVHAVATDLLCQSVMTDECADSLTPLGCFLAMSAANARPGSAATANDTQQQQATPSPSSGGGKGNGAAGSGGGSQAVVSGPGVSALGEGASAAEAEAQAAGMSGESIGAAIGAALGGAFLATVVVGAVMYHRVVRRKRPRGGPSSEAEAAKAAEQPCGIAQPGPSSSGSDLPPAPSQSILLPVAASHSALRLRHHPPTPSPPSHVHPTRDTRDAGADQLPPGPAPPTVAVMMGGGRPAGSVCGADAGTGSAAPVSGLAATALPGGATRPGAADMLPPHVHDDRSSEQHRQAVTALAGAAQGPAAPSAAPVAWHLGGPGGPAAGGTVHEGPDNGIGDDVSSNGGGRDLQCRAYYGKPDAVQAGGDADGDAASGSNGRGATGERASGLPQSALRRGDPVGGLISTLPPVLDPPTSSGGRGFLGHISADNCLPVTHATPPRADVQILPDPKGSGSNEVTMLPKLPRGTGSFGRVCEGMYQGQLVAVKLVANRHEWDDPSAGLIRQFAQEVEVLGRCHHPNVVRLLAACLTPPRMCLVMELMEASLEDRLYKQPGLMPLETVLHIGLQIARGLDYLHPTIVHRDLKPANVLLNDAWSPRPVVKLTDFGLSRLRSTAVPTLTPGAGTPAYLAPECFESTDGIITHKADMYSFGVLLWEMLAGRIPWEGTHLVRLALLVSRNGCRPALSDLPESRCPPKLRALLWQCWEADPQRRPAAAEAAKYIMLVQQATLREEQTDAASAGRANASTHDQPEPRRAAVGAVFGGLLRLRPTPAGWHMEMEVHPSFRPASPEPHLEMCRGHAHMPAMSRLAAPASMQGPSGANQTLSVVASDAQPSSAVTDIGLCDGPTTQTTGDSLARTTQISRVRAFYERLKSLRGVLHRAGSASPVQAHWVQPCVAAWQGYGAAGAAVGAVAGGGDAVAAAAESGPAWCSPAEFSISAGAAGGDGDGDGGRTSSKRLVVSGPSAGTMLFLSVGSASKSGGQGHD